MNLHAEMKCSQAITAEAEARAQEINFREKSDPARLAAVQALDIGICIDAGSVAPVSLPVRAHIAEWLTISRFAQRLGIRDSRHPRIDDARRQFARWFGRDNLNHAGHRVAVIDWE